MSDTPSDLISVTDLQQEGMGHMVGVSARYHDQSWEEAERYGLSPASARELAASLTAAAGRIETALPAPKVAVPEGYMADSKGRLVPEQSVRPVEVLEDQMVKTVIGYALALSAQVARFKGHVYDDCNSYLSLAEEEYGVTKRGARGRGNVTFTSFCGLMKVQLAVADRLTFGPELQVARQLFDECIADWTADARAELRVLVDSAFEADREGQVSRDAVFRLLRVSFDDHRWQRGQDAIRDSIRIIGSKSYCRFYVRETPDAKWQAVSIDLAAV